MNRRSGVGSRSNRGRRKRRNGPIRRNRGDGTAPTHSHQARVTSGSGGPPPGAMAPVGRGQGEVRPARRAGGGVLPHSGRVERGDEGGGDGADGGGAARGPPPHWCRPARA